MGTHRRFNVVHPYTIGYSNRFQSIKDRLSLSRKHYNIVLFCWHLIFGILNLMSVVTFWYVDAEEAGWGTPGTTDTYFAEYQISQRAFNFQGALALLFLLSFIGNVAVAVSYRARFFSNDAFVELVTSLPVICVWIGSSFNSDLRLVYVPFFLRVWPLLNHVNVCVDMAAPRYLQAPLAEISHLIASMFTAAGLFHLCENLVVSDAERAARNAANANALTTCIDRANTTKTNTVSFFTSLYMICVTFSTIGYGDVEPTNRISRLVTSFIIIYALYRFPSFFKKMGELAESHDRTLEYDGHLKGNAHVVISGDLDTDIIAEVLDMFCRSGHLVREVDGQKFRIVLLSPNEFSQHTQLLVNGPTFDGRVTLLRGTPGLLHDLNRARVGDALAHFYVCSPQASSDAADTATIMQTRKHVLVAPDVPQYLVIRRSENAAVIKNRIGTEAANRATVLERDKVLFALMGTACVIPGAVPLLMSLAGCATKELHGKNQHPWCDQYEWSLENEVMRCACPSALVGKTFFQIADIFAEFDITCLGFEVDIEVAVDVSEELQQEELLRKCSPGGGGGAGSSATDAADATTSKTNTTRQENNKSSSDANNITNSKSATADEFGGFFDSDDSGQGDDDGSSSPSSEDDDDDDDDHSPLVSRARAAAAKRAAAKKQKKKKQHTSMKNSKDSRRGSSRMKHDPYDDGDNKNESDDDDDDDDDGPLELGETTTGTSKSPSRLQKILGLTPSRTEKKDLQKKKRGTMGNLRDLMSRVEQGEKRRQREQAAAELIRERERALRMRKQVFLNPRGVHAKADEATRLLVVGLSPQIVMTAVEQMESNPELVHQLESAASTDDRKRLAASAFVELLASDRHRHHNQLHRAVTAAGDVAMQQKRASPAASAQQHRAREQVARAVKKAMHNNNNSNNKNSAMNDNDGEGVGDGEDELQVEMRDVNASSTRTQIPEVRVVGPQPGDNSSVVGGGTNTATTSTSTSALQSKRNSGTDASNMLSANTSSSSPQQLSSSPPLAPFSSSPSTPPLTKVVRQEAGRAGAGAGRGAMVIIPGFSELILRGPQAHHRANSILTDHVLLLDLHSACKVDQSISQHRSLDAEKARARKLFTLVRTVMVCNPHATSVVLLSRGSVHKTFSDMWATTQFPNPYHVDGCALDGNDLRDCRPEDARGVAIFSTYDGAVDEDFDTMAMLASRSVDVLRRKKDERIAMMTAAEHRDRLTAAAQQQVSSGGGPSTLPSGAPSVSVSRRTSATFASLDAFQQQQRAHEEMPRVTTIISFSQADSIALLPPFAKPRSLLDELAQVASSYIPSFIAGRVMTTSMVESLLFFSFFSTSLLDVVDSMLSINSDKPAFGLKPLPPNCRTWRDVRRSMRTSDGLQPIALYRLIKSIQSEEEEARGLTPGMASGLVDGEYEDDRDDSENVSKFAMAAKRSFMYRARLVRQDGFQSEAEKSARSSLRFVYLNPQLQTPLVSSDLVFYLT